MHKVLQAESLHSADEALTYVSRSVESVAAMLDHHVSLSAMDTGEKSSSTAATPVGAATASAHDHSSEVPECSSGSGNSTAAAKPRCGQLDRRVAPDGPLPHSAYEARRDQVTLKLECETASEARVSASFIKDCS